MINSIALDRHAYFQGCAFSFQHHSALNWMGRKIHDVAVVIFELVKSVVRCVKEYFFSQREEEEAFSSFPTEINGESNPLISRSIENSGEEVTPSVHLFHEALAAQESEHLIDCVPLSEKNEEGMPMPIENRLENEKRISDSVKSETSSVELFEFVPSLESATALILESGRFERDGYEKKSFKKGFKGEVQGTARLRMVAAQETKKHLHALGLESLNSHRFANEQFLIFKLKRFGHACHLKGYVTLPSMKRMNLEGFCEAYTIPMIASSFDLFSSDRASVNWIAEEVNQMTSSDAITETEIEEIACKIQDPHFIGPISIASGFDWHATAAIFFGDYLLYCNRGFGSDGQAGISVYHLNNRQLVTKEVIHELAKRQEFSKNGYLSIDRIEQRLDARRIYVEEMTKQEVGNCTYVSIHTALLGLMAIKQLRDFYGESALGEEEIIEEEIWMQVFAANMPHYEQWLSFDKEMVIADFIEDMQQLLSKEFEPTLLPIMQAYYEAADLYLRKNAFCQTHDVLKNQIRQLMKEIKKHMPQLALT